MVASNNATMQRILKISLAATFLYVCATLCDSSEYASIAYE